MMTTVMMERIAMRRFVEGEYMLFPFRIQVEFNLRESLKEMLDSELFSDCTIKVCFFLDIVLFYFK